MYRVVKGVSPVRKFADVFFLQHHRGSDADPEILHGRWLIGWLPIVNYTGARGVAQPLINNGGYLQTSHKRTGEGGG